jgi:hypothetical protein
VKEETENAPIQRENKKKSSGRKKKLLFCAGIGFSAACIENAAWPTQAKLLVLVYKEGRITPPPSSRGKGKKK